MDCIGPVTPDDADFLAYADHAASAAVQKHVSACPACRERADQIAREQQTLQVLLHRAGCPRSLDLGEYHLGLAGEQRAAELAEHLACCHACRAELADLATFMKRLRRPLEDAAGQAFGSLRTVVARLSLGPLADPFGALAPAVRGPGDNTEQGPVVYEAEDILITVDSWIERLGQPGRVVAGLVVGPEGFAGAEASMETTDTSRIAAINDLGNFLFSGVSPGPHHLMIRLPATGLQIEIDDLTVK